MMRKFFTWIGAIRHPIFCGSLFLSLALTVPTEASVAPRSLPVKFIGEVTIDDDGRSLHYPFSLFYDPGEQEVYLINGGTSKVVVYGSDLFPQMSIGTGRGVFAPRAVHVTRDGLVYISQSRTASDSPPRITILNGAFFKVREILLDEIPEAAGIAPSNLAVSRDGLIYLTGTASRGVLVLDNEGNFLRRLRPMDIISDREAIAAAAQEAAAEETQAEEAREERASRSDIPEEFRPRSRQQAAESGPGMGPVRVNKVIIDNSGNLFLISGETSKIYVYGPDETFLYSFGSKGGTTGRLSQPRSLAVDDKRKLIFVVDYMRHTILIYDFEGKFRFELGGRGTGPGWFNFPVDIAINRQGQLIVADLFNRRVQVLEPDYEGDSPVVQAQPAPAAKPGGGKQEAESGGQEIEGDAEGLPLDSDSLPEEELPAEGIHDWPPEAEFVEKAL
jgi:DNA-binding beta-propeller fold protein YncE